MPNVSNRHLSPDQFSALLAHTADPEIRAHVNACTSCGDEAARLEGLFSAFGNSVRDCTARMPQASSQTFALRANRVSNKSFAKLSWACTALATMAVLLFLTRATAPVAPQSHSPVVSITDAALLQQVNSAVSESVPGPMQPLTSLVSWDGKEFVDNE